MKIKVVSKIHTWLLSYRRSYGWRRKEVERYLSNHAVAKLQIGCGPYPLEGWLNTDLLTNYRKESPFFLDAGKPFPIPDASFDYVYSEHLFEHLTFLQANNMLKECYRILKPGGIIRIATPNLKFLVDLYDHPEKSINKAYLEHDAERSGMPFGPAYTISRFHTSWGHQIIYDPETLTHFLESVGFSNVRPCEVSLSDHEDLCGVEQHFKFLKPEFNLLETMILEACR